GFLLVNADHGSCRELVLARFDYNARVVRKAASSSLSSEKAPRIRSISEYWMVARLPVMITESINKPDPFALSLSARTTTCSGVPHGPYCARSWPQWSGASLRLVGLPG